MLHVLVIEPGKPIRRVRLGAKPASAGALALNAIPLAGPRVAPEHLTLTARGRTAELAVVGKAGAVLVNGEAARTATIVPGDRVHVGEALLVLEEVPAAVPAPDARERSFAAAERVFELVELFDGETSPRRALTASLDTLIDLFGASRGLILEVSPELKPHVLARRGEWPAGTAPEVSRTVLGRLATSTRPLLVADVQGESDLAAAASIAVTVRSVVAGPLRRDGALVGAVYLESAVEARAFGEAERKFLARFSGWVVKLLERSQTTGELREETERLRELARREQEEHADLDALVGTSEAIRKVKLQIRQVAETDVTTLVLGESGTGKELVARAVHALSRRAGRPFVAINCTALPEELVESELFGHVAGAFSGAQRDRVGRFELASSGTLFLDEVGDLSMGVQAKLLRALQERVITRVGDTRDRKVDVRFVGATNAPLPERIAEGRFREDLFFRLSVFTIPLPPLRERAGDVGLLAEAFVKRFAAEMNRDIDGLDRAALQTLAAYEWPGNVRELGNLIQQAVVRETSNRITPASLLFALSPGAAPRSTSARLPDFGPNFELATARFQIWFLERSLAEAGGDVSRLLKRIGLPKATFYRKCAALGIEPSRFRRDPA